MNTHAHTSVHACIHTYIHMLSAPEFEITVWYLCMHACQSSSRMCLCIHACMHVGAAAGEGRHHDERSCSRVHTYILTCTHSHIYIHIHEYMRVCVYIYIDIHIYIYMCVYVYCTYTQTHTHNTHTLFDLHVYRTSIVETYLCNTKGWKKSF
jgi:hypothetical protein